MDHSEVKHLPKVDHTPNELDDASKALLKAAAVIERDGLWKGENGRRHDTTTCMVLAINGPGQREADERLKRALGVRGLEGIYAWNDAPGRTQEEVVAKLRAVAFHRV